MEKQISVKNVSKIYKTHEKPHGLINTFKNFFSRKYTQMTAVDDVSFHVNSGEILGLVGLNGAGKTTIIKMVSGVIQPSSGQIEVLNHNPFKKATEYKKNVALVMGNKGQLDYDVTIIDNIMLYASIYGIDTKTGIKRAEEMAYELEMEKRELYTQVRNLSLGQRMKGELILAFLHQPKIIFLDEPTLGLDFVTQRKIRSYLNKYKKAHQASIILTSHYFEDIEELCDDLLIIDKGKMIYNGDISELRNKVPQYKKISFMVPESKYKTMTALTDGSIDEYKNGKVTIRVKSCLLPSFLQKLVNNYEVSDITISDDNLDIVIESLYQERVVS